MHGDQRFLHQVLDVVGHPREPLAQVPAPMPAKRAQERVVLGTLARETANEALVEALLDRPIAAVAGSSCHRELWLRKAPDRRTFAIVPARRRGRHREAIGRTGTIGTVTIRTVTIRTITIRTVTIRRSEERRVGKECRSRWSP